MRDARARREEGGQRRVVLEGVKANPGQRGRLAVERHVPRLVEVPEEEDAERRRGQERPCFTEPRRAAQGTSPLLECASPGPPDEFGSRATVPSEPCQVRKEAALRSKARAPRIARTHRGARGLFFEYSHLRERRELRPPRPQMAPAHVRGRRRPGGDRPGPHERRDGQDRLAHAYLFSGPRGVGKTTTARLLAAAINCNTSDRPTADALRDVRLVHRRSSRGARSTRSRSTAPRTARSTRRATSSRSSRTRPSRDRRKVFIIDEVHAISSAAFQALLKTLEEPPAHAVFILATTERHKIPATILSRCQRFDFRRLTDDEVADRLADVAGREGFAVVESASAAKKAVAVRRARPRSAPSPPRRRAASATGSRSSTRPPRARAAA